MAGNDKWRIGQINTYQNANISIYVYQWSDIIVENRRRLSFLGNALKIKDTNIQEFIKEKYTDYEIKKSVLLDE